MNDDKNMEMDIKYSALFVLIVSIACERFFCVCFHSHRICKLSVGAQNNVGSMASSASSRDVT